MQVRLDNALSQRRYLTAGVPQGSHIAPLLFNLYIDSLPSSCPNVPVRLFADDTSILRSVSSQDSLATYQRVLQDDALDCEQWATHVGASFNPLKSQHLRFTSPRSKNATTPTPVITLAGIQLHQPTYHRHLGVALDTNLNFAHHIHTITQKFRTRIFLLSHMAHSMPHSVIALLYKSYVSCRN